MERVDALIDRVMKQFPGVSALAQARYYEEVHQELAPLAREIELQRDRLLESLRETGTSEPAPADHFAAAAKMTAIVDNYLAGYEFDDGESCHHTPNETEQLLIGDAVHGLLADGAFLDALTDWWLMVRARKQTEAKHGA